jgi:pimeloyl-ACP methyl ester carboxylesterase
VHQCIRAAASLPLIFVTASLAAQETAPWRDPSPHAVRFVTVDQDVRLEVLDWGGSGRPIVLLAGGGNTAHVFDDFAPKLSADFHVYGITRRGFGASTFATFTDVDRAGADVLAVLDAERIEKPVLVGHSLGGAELSSVAKNHSDRIAGLVYLEAGYPYAFHADTGPAMEEFLALNRLLPPMPRADAPGGFAALQEWDERRFGFRLPEGEFRQTWEPTSDGRSMRQRPSPGSSILMTMATAKINTNIPAPALVFFALPHVPETWMTSASDPAARAAVETALIETDALTARQAAAFEAGVLTARIVKLRASHYIFISNEQEVLREIRAFVSGLE